MKRAIFSNYSFQTGSNKEIAIYALSLRAIRQRQRERRRDDGRYRRVVNEGDDRTIDLNTRSEQESSAWIADDELRCQRADNVAVGLRDIAPRLSITLAPFREM